MLSNRQLSDEPLESYGGEGEEPLESYGGEGEEPLESYGGEGEDFETRINIFFASIGHVFFFGRAGVGGEVSCWLLCMNFSLQIFPCTIFIFMNIVHGKIGKICNTAPESTFI